MNAFTKMIGAAAIALTVAGAAAPATAASVFSQWSSNAAGTNFMFKNGAANNSSVNGSFFTTATSSATTVGATSISFTLFDNPDLLNIMSALTFSGTSSVAAGFSTSTGTYTQTNINGSFSIKYLGVSQFYGSTFVANGSNLLSGSFTNAWIQGAGTNGGIDIDLTNGGFMTGVTSDYDTFANVIPGSESFAIHLAATGNGIGSVNPSVNSNGLGTTALKTFRAQGGGNFSNSVVPEPASWALMIMGFGGVGAMLRNRRRVAFA